MCEHVCAFVKACQAKCAENKRVQKWNDARENEGLCWGAEWPLIECARRKHCARADSVRDTDWRSLWNKRKHPEKSKTTKRRWLRLSQHAKWKKKKNGCNGNHKLLLTLNNSVNFLCLSVEGKVRKKVSQGRQHIHSFKVKLLHEEGAKNPSKLSASNENAKKTRCKKEQTVRQPRAKITPQTG